jgi:hypothetical protein
MSESLHVGPRSRTASHMPFGTARGISPTPTRKVGSAAFVRAPDLYLGFSRGTNNKTGGTNSHGQASGRALSNEAGQSQKLDSCSRTYGDQHQRERGGKKAALHDRGICTGIVYREQACYERLTNTAETSAGRSRC